MSLSDTAQQREQAARTLDERREGGFVRFARAIGYTPKSESIHPARVPDEEVGAAMDAERPDRFEMQ